MKEKKIRLTKKRELICDEKNLYNGVLDIHFALYIGKITDIELLNYGILVIVLQIKIFITQEVFIYLKKLKTILMVPHIVKTIFLRWKNLVYIT